MDKSLGALYNKLSNLFHSNPQPIAPTTAPVPPPPEPETSSSFPMTNFFDRIVPIVNHSPRTQRQSSATRISRQISIKTNDNLIRPDLPQQKQQA